MSKKLWTREATSLLGYGLGKIVVNVNKIKNKDITFIVTGHKHKKSPWFPHPNFLLRYISFLLWH